MKIESLKAPLNNSEFLVEIPSLFELPKIFRKALEVLIDKIINENREKAIEYKQGKEKLFGFFVGQAMKASGGKANPQLINEILKKKL